MSVDAETRKRLERLELEVERLRSVVDGPVQPWPGTDDAISAPPQARSKPVEVALPPPPAPIPTKQGVSRPRSSHQALEARIGTRWLAVAGIVLVVVASGLFLRLAIKNGWIGPAAQVGIGFVLGLAIWGFGLYLDRAKRLGEFAHVLAGGGVAITAFAVFAAHHFPKYHEALGISLVGDSILLVLVAAGALLDAVLRRAEVQALVAATLGSVIPLLALDLTRFSLALAVLMAFILLGASTWRRWPTATVFAAVGPFMTVFVHLVADVPAGDVWTASALLLLGFTAVGIRVRGADDAHALSVVFGQAFVWVATWGIGIWAFDQWGLDGAAWWTLGLGLAAGAFAFVPGSDRTVRWTWGGLAIAGLIGFAPFLRWPEALAFVWIVELGVVATMRIRWRGTATTTAAGVLLGLLSTRLMSREALQIYERLDGWALDLVLLVGGIAAIMSVWVMDRNQKDQGAVLAQFHLAVATGLALVLIAVLGSGPGVSLAWGLLAVALVGIGFAVRRVDLRAAGLAAFALTLGRIVLFDLAGVDAIWRVAAFAGVGALLLVTSWLYVRWVRSAPQERS